MLAAHTYLETLWSVRPLVDGDLTFTFLPSKLSEHAPLSAVLADGPENAGYHDVLHENKDGQNVYIGLGLREAGLSSSERGRTQSVISLPGFAVDFDFRHPTAHAAKELPTVDDMPLLLDGAPDPSMVVSSGHGWHVYWLFQKPWEFDGAPSRKTASLAYKAFARQFVERSKKHGWHLDNTAGIDRIWRVPGYVNHKTGAAVELLHHSSARYDLRTLTPEGTKRAAPPSAVRATTNEPLTPVENELAPQDVLEAMKRTPSENKPLLKLVLAGKSFAERGERDAVLNRVCSSIAFLPESVPYDADVLAEILRPSLSAWAAEPGADKTVEQELAKAVDKLTRAKAAYDDRKEDEARRLEPLAAALRMGTRRAVEEALESGEPAPAVPEVTAAVAVQHAIIQSKSSYWVWSFVEQKYVGPRISSELSVTARDCWDNDDAPKALTLYRWTERGTKALKTVSDLMDEYGTAANQIEGRMALDASYYDAVRKVFVEAVAPMRVIEPRYDEHIAAWLKELAGDQEEKLLDWIAAVPQLDRQCCALYLAGTSGAGKGLLASGLARLWHTGGATPLETVLGSYNQDMFECPLILLDEGLSNQRNTSAAIRQVLGTNVHTAREKYVVNRRVQGAVRLLIAANNDNVLAFGEENVSADDLEAYVGRFLHIRAQREAADWLVRNNPGNVLTTKWVQEDLLAKHCLWLAFNRTIVPGKRFLVEGTGVSEMHRKLVMQGDGAGLVYEWVARFASDPKKLRQSYVTKKQSPLGRVGGGQLLVNSQGVIDNWAMYMGDDLRRPSTTKIGSTLAKLSEGVCKVGGRGKQLRFHSLRADLVIGWSDQNQVGDSEQISANLAAPDPTDDEA